MMVTGGSEASTSTGAPSLRAAALQKQTAQWKDLFLERIYLTCNHAHPGMGLEYDAVLHISDILCRILSQILEQKPESIDDLSDKVRSTFPSTLANFIMKNHNPKEDLHNLLNKPKSKEGKSLNAFYHRIYGIVKETLNRKLEDVAVMLLVSILEYVLYDILNWSGTYVSKLMENSSLITLSSLQTAINADRGLAELVESIYGDEEVYGRVGAFSHIGESSKDSEPKTPTSSSYDKICQNFKSDEVAFMEDMNTICNVFKRGLEAGIGSDAEGKRIIKTIFGNAADIFELTIKIHRTIEDGLEMSDPPCMGAGLAELAEGMEFDVYITFMEIFEEPLIDILSQLVKNPKYKPFFDLEDRTYSAAPDGQTFRMAVKFVLPSLLQSVYEHFYGYAKYVKLLHASTQTEIDRNDLYEVECYLSQVANRIEDFKPTTFNMKEQTFRTRRTNMRSDHIGKIIQIQRSIDGWVGKEIGFMCNEFIREGDLFKIRSGPTLRENLLRGKGWTERHVFLFDHLLVICKTVKSGKGISYKYKDQFDIRKTDIFDLEDEEDVKYAFKIRCGRKESERYVTLFCHTATEKVDWMTSLVEMQSAGILHRMKDSYMKEEERRIPLMIPTPSEYRYAEPDTDENIVFEDYTHNSGVPVVRSGTIIKLIERLTYPYYIDNEFVKTFMTTYRSFCSPMDLLTLLIERFNIPVPTAFSHLDQQNSSHTQRSGGPLAGRFDTVQSHGLPHNQMTTTNLEQAFLRFRQEYQKPIQQKVVKIMHHWVRYHFYDFENDEKLTQRMLDFLSGNDRTIRMTNVVKKLCSKISDAIKKKTKEISETKGDQNEENVSAAECNDWPDSLWHVAQKGDVENYDLLTLHPLEIGRQVTLLHFCMYKAIKPIELVDAAWTKQEKDENSPQLLKLIDHSTKLTYWVAKSIVETESLEERVEMFGRVLEIMCVFEELNNFNGVVAFYSALNCSSVFRLKESKQRLDREKQAWYSRFHELCQPHWKEMLQRLRSINPPCVPFAGTYLSQIFFFETGKSTFVQSSHDLAAENDSEKTESSRKMVSFMKCRKIAAVIREIQMYQNQPYALNVEPSIWQFFEAINPLKGFKDKDELETYLYNQSLRIEPKSGEIESLSPKHSLDALKSPGIKATRSHFSPNTFQRSKSHNAHHQHTHLPSPSQKMAPKSTVTSPVQKSPPVHIPPPSANSSNGTAEENHFAIVDISPGQQPRWVGDAGRINQAFTSEYMTQSWYNGPSSPQSPVPPASTPGHGLASLALDPQTRFAFPPPAGSANSPHGADSRHFHADSTPPIFPLSQPPAVRRRQSDKTPRTTPNDVPRRPAPSLPPKSPPATGAPPLYPKSPRKSDVCDSPTPNVPPRNPPVGKHLPSPLPSDTLTQLINNSRSPSPRSPTVSLLVPLPSAVSNRYHPAELHDPSEATAPPRPPKSSSISRNPSAEPITSPLLSDDELKPPPLPPKNPKAPPLPPKAGDQKDPRLLGRPTTDREFFAPPIPPKPKNQN